MNHSTRTCFLDSRTLLDEPFSNCETMKIKISIAVILLIAVALCYSTFHAVQKARARQSDLNELVAAFGEIEPQDTRTNVLTLSDLTNLMAKKGKRLANPYAIKPSEPSYRVGPGLKAGIPSYPNQVIIEETENVNLRRRVRILGDGSVH
jgi:hypothetical protein